LGADEEGLVDLIYGQIKVCIIQFEQVADVLRGMHHGLKVHFGAERLDVSDGDIFGWLNSLCRDPASGITKYSK
jgi:hypothetical protein